MIEQSKELEKEEYRKVYINLVREFTEKTKEKAQMEDITLINGIDFSKMYLKTMM